MIGKITKLLPALLLLAAVEPGHVKKPPVLPAPSLEATVTDGEHVRLNWRCDPNAAPDIYYVNVPRKNGKVTFRTNMGVVSFVTRFGRDYDFVMKAGPLLCHVRVSAKDDPGLVQYSESASSSPHVIPFSMRGSRVYLVGQVNGGRPVDIQFDLGAGSSFVNKLSSNALALRFDTRLTVANSQGRNEARSSSSNTLVIGNLKWTDVAFTEVGNMQADEDLIIGNSLFRDKIIELDYDRKLLIVRDSLPHYAHDYRAQPVIYEQNRPKFEATIRQNGDLFSFWFLFDTGRDGSMLIGQEFTRENENWNKLQPFQMLNGRKIVRVDALLGGQIITDVVTNASDPISPAWRATLFGNQILNHFNMILDNQTGMLYLRPNSRIDEPYSRYNPGMVSGLSH